MKTMVRDVLHNGEVASTLKFLILEQAPDVVQMHHEVFQWSPEIYKEHLLIWGEIQAGLTKAGISKILVSQKKELADDKMLKYWKLFGFRVFESEYEGQDLMLGEVELGHGN